MIALCVSLAFMPVDASDFTLNIFGNANMDDTIDDLDIEYVQGIIDGTSEVTMLADANYDGNIDEEDINQIELIMDGTETELTFIDCVGKNSTVHKTKPLVKIVAVHSSTIEALRILDAHEGIVGIDEWTFTNYPTLRSDLSDAQSVGAYADLDAETILELRPDVVICGPLWHDPNLEDKLNGTGIDVVRLWLSNPDSHLSDLRILGYLLDKEDNALAYNEWYDNCLNNIIEKTSTLSEDQKPSVLLYRYSTSGKTTCGGDTAYQGTLEIAGGTNVAAELSDYPELDVEWALTQNPDVIIGISFSGGYESDNSSVLEEVFEDIITTPGFDQLSAVKDGNVFVRYSALGGPLAEVYTAKWLHPDLFTDLDPMSIQQELITKFLRLDFDLEERGAFVYP